MRIDCRLHPLWPSLLKIGAGEEDKHSIPRLRLAAAGCLTIYATDPRLEGQAADRIVSAYVQNMSVRAGRNKT